MRFENVTKKYGEKTVLDVDFELQTGKITAILGESGAGKSTLLSIAAGLIPHEGKVVGAGRASYLFQEPKLLPNLTLRDNLRFVLDKEKWHEVEPMLARVGLEGREKSYPHTLSGGERQRVAVARAFLFPHDVLLMDEPFSSVGVSLKRTLLELVYELWHERGDTVAYVTHDVHEAATICHRAIILKEGKIILDLPVEGDLPRDFNKPQPIEEQFLRALTGC